MLAAEKLTELREQKKLLLAESAINRRILAVHWACATGPVRQLKAGYDWLASLRPYWAYVVPVGAVLLVRRRPKAGVVSRFLFVWRVGKRLLNLWRFWESLPREK
jgi:hypothetical protein